MESIVKMGVKSPGDKRRGDSGQPADSAAEQRIAGSVPAFGADYTGIGSGIPGAGFTAGTASAARSAAAAKKGVPEGRTAGSSAGRKDGDGADTSADPAQTREKTAADIEKKNIRNRRRQYRMIAEYVVVTVLITYILLRFADNLGVVLRMLGGVAKTVGGLLQPLFWGFIVAYILAPMADFFERKFRRIKLFRKKPAKRRGAAVAVTFILALLILAALLSIIASALSKSLRVASIEDLVLVIQSLAGTLRSMQKSIQQWLVDMNISSTEVATALTEIGQQAARFTSGLSSSVTGTVSQIGGMLTSSIFVLIFSIYFLLDKKGLLSYWKRVILAIGGKKARKYCRIIIHDADMVFSGYIRGQLIDAFIMTILVSSALSLIGMKYWIIIGILSGIGNLIPYLGPVVGYGSTIIVSLFVGDWKRMIVAIVAIFVIQTVDGNVINPHLLSTSIDVHPMLVIAALIIGGATGGIVGMLFAVPVAAFFKIQFDKLITRLFRMRMPELADAEAQKKTRRRKKRTKKNRARTRRSK